MLAEIAAVGGTPSEEVLSGIVEKRLREEIRRGVQTIQYQVVTLMTTNGQAPFVTVFMYLGEVDDPQTKRDLALIIEETLVQRYEGVKNEEGVWITPRLETMFLPSSAKYTYVSSSMVKEMARYGAELSDFVPRALRS